MVITSTIGFPRIGPKRELKKAVESLWKGDINEEELLLRSDDIRLTNYRIQKEKGIDLIPSWDCSLYDKVLDHSVLFGQIPERYLKFGEPTSTEVYFAMARGKEASPPLEMTKWFDTNYHYIVPELTSSFELTENLPLREYLFAKSEGIDTKPVLLGPYTFLKLAKLADEEVFKQKLYELLPLYKKILKELDENGAGFIQIEEPALIYGEDSDLVQTCTDLYKKLSSVKSSSKWILQTYFEHIDEHFRTVTTWPFDYIGLDFVRGIENLDSLKRYSLPKDKRLALGIIDGRNVWKSDLKKTVKILAEVKDQGYLNDAIVQPSCSLMHIPYSLKKEKFLSKELKGLLSFAEERLDELAILKKTLLNDLKLPSNYRAPDLSSFSTITKTRERIKNIKEHDFQRNKPFPERACLQQRKLNLPLLPTTTIGSFPQTDELRKVRVKWKTKKITPNEYKEYIHKEIIKVIELQEEIGLDVLVHGEFERTDMVEFFGQKLNGFFFTKSGWVQSYGSRCVKPPIIYGDVERTAPMTVEKITFAQSRTTKPVKGMLTGPVTIINWSFPREDIKREEIAFQIALALRDETLDLEKSGISIIQIDEPALREGLPIKKDRQQEYLDWAVRSFRLCSSGVKDDTQIHTHMCYSDFNEIIRTIYDLDADVISIENARSSDELLSVFKDFNYDHYIGPGVWDVHSPTVPLAEEIEDKIKKVSNHIKKELLWINPDCGLKTRDYPETIESLKNMVRAAQKLREEL